MMAHKIFVGQPVYKIYLLSDVSTLCILLLIQFNKLVSMQGFLIK